MPPSDDLLPQRNWEDLVAVSRRRGQQLRLRRRLAVGVPLLTLSAALALGPVSWPAAESDPDRLILDHADRPDGTRHDQRTPTVAAVPGAPGRTDGADPSDARSASALATPPPAPTRSPATTSLTSVQQAQASPPTFPAVSFEDPTGDADTRDGALGSGAVTDAARDIVSMTFERQSNGIRVTLRLAADRANDSVFYAYATDARSGCEIAMFMGNPEDDGFYVHCGDVTSDYIRVPRSPDPSLRELALVVPYELVPDRVDLRGDLTGLAGASWTQHLGNAEARVDSAGTNRPLRRAT